MPHEINTLYTLQKNIDTRAYIAKELESRLLEHCSQEFLLKKKLDVLRQSNAASLMGGKLIYPDATFDAVIAHMVMLWQKDIKTFVEEVYRIILPNGIFLFSMLKNSTHTLESLGDLLLKQGFKFPVMDREIIQFDYEQEKILREDLRLSGLSEQDVDICYISPHQIIMNIEVFYGYSQGKNVHQETDISISVSSIKKRMLR